MNWNSAVRWIMNATTRRIGIPLVIAASLLGAFILGMWLAPGSTQGAADDGDGVSESSTSVWTCSMHPQIRSSEPGKCPICGMDLIPAGTSNGPSASGTVTLSDRARDLIGLRTAEVARLQTAEAPVELLGRVEPAETLRKDVTSWVGGRVDSLRLDTTGETVKRGEIVATLYSPEVYSAHQDLLTARAQVRTLKDGTQSAQRAAVSALRAAEQRLRLLGVPEAELTRLADASSPTRAVSIRSPFRGTVLDRVVTEGAYVKTGDPLYRIADLGTVWVQLDAYERDLMRLAEGQTVSIQVESLPGETFTGTVAFIDPTVDARQRTAKVRVEVDNPEGRLRPGLFASARVSAPPQGLSAPLVIPDTAPLFTGRRSIVYVQSEVDGARSYVPRVVRLGPRLGAHYPIVSGLVAGERVVSRGAFAIDADLQIRGGPSMMMQADGSDETVGEPVLLSVEERAALRPALEAYLAIQRSLAQDDLAAAKEASRILVGHLAPTLPARAEAAWQETSDPLEQHARHVTSSEDIGAARGGFEALSRAVEELLARFGNPLDEPIHVAFCPMAMNSEGARWVQQGDTIDNAYFGESMRGCGEIQERVPANAYLSPPAPKVVTGPNPHAGHQH